MSDSNPVTVNPHNVVVELSVEAAKAVAALLGKAVDRTASEALQRLYDNFYAAGLADGPFEVTVEFNPDFDPSDEDDFAEFIVVSDA